MYRIEKRKHIVNPDSHVINFASHTERTLAIIKPNTVKAQHSGSIITQIERAGFTVQAIKKHHLTLAEAQEFYKVHATRPFYQDLCTYMASGPVVIMVLEKKTAIRDYRNLIGVTDPAQANPHTLRSQFGTSIDHNALHGSDATETAQAEIKFFFPNLIR